MTQGEIEKLTKKIEGIFNRLEEDVLEDIVRLIKANGFSPASADWKISRLQQLGASEETIKKYVKDALKATDAEINQIFDDKVSQQWYGFKRAYQVNGFQQIKFEDNIPLQQLINATKSQLTKGFDNLANSMGFAVRNLDGTIQNVPLMEFYRKTLDDAVIGISSGSFSYNTMLERAINTMTGSGLRWVDYDSGWHNRVPVAARRAVMTGFRQVQAEINDQVAKQLDTDSYEVSWHAGARPSHQVWQGRVYTRRELIDICGLGSVTGLCGANCYHDYNAFIPGVSVRTYTDEWLEQMNAEENTPKDYNGKKYTTYQALQRQRTLETAARKYREDIKLLKLGGADPDQITRKKAKYNGVLQEYADFSDKMNLPMQKDRIWMDGLTAKKSSAKKTVNVANGANSGILISGARITDPDSTEGETFAKMYYEEIRHLSTDVSKIANNTGHSEEEVKKVKDYLFINDSLYDEDLGKYVRFSPDCAIAQSWQRLMIGKDIKPHDRTLLNHEILEMKIKQENPGIDHLSAHRKAEEKYNYTKEVIAYYGSIRSDQKNR